VIEGAADEGAQPDGVGGHLGDDPANGVGHLHVQGDEVKTVNALPLIEAGADLRGVTVKQFGVGQKSGVGTRCVLLEKVVLVH
jgi:hypothetical protein